MKKIHYKFICPDCKNTNYVKTTGHKEINDFVDCISCGRKSKITFTEFVFDVELTKNKKRPSALEELEIKKAMNK